jgi:hypothetical protein
MWLFAMEIYDENSRAFAEQKFMALHSNPSTLKSLINFPKNI